LHENDNNPVKNDLLATVMEIIHGQKGQSINELVSLLALSNLLGIICFLNSQDLKFDFKTQSSKSNLSEIKELAQNLLGSMASGGPSGASDKKLNPVMLLNLLQAMAPPPSKESANNINNPSKKNTQNPENSAEK